jgi:hypothetical protein
MEKVLNSGTSQSWLGKICKLEHQKCLTHTDFIHSLTIGAYQFYVGPFKKFYLMLHNMIIYKLHV